MPRSQVRPLNFPSVNRAKQNALAIRTAENRNILAEKQLGTFDENQAWTRKQRGFVEDVQKRQARIADWQQEDRPMEKARKSLKWFRDEASLINWSNYPKSREYMIEKGINPALLPDPQAMLQESLNAGIRPEAYFEQWKDEATRTIDQQLGLEKEKIRAAGKAKPVARAMKTWVGPGGDIVNLPNNEAPPAGYVPYSTGMDIEVGPEGTRIRTGMGRKGVGASGLQSGTVKKIEEKQFNTSEQLARLDEIRTGYQMEFLEWGPRLKAIGTATEEKLRGTWAEGVFTSIFGKASPEDKQFLEDYTTWITTTVNNANLHIKEITGAQMSKEEAGRIMKGVIDAEGLIVFDSHTKMKGKMDSIDRSLRLTLARTEMYLKNGFTTEDIKEMSSVDDKSLKSHRIKLNDVQQTINKEGKALMEEDGMTQEEATAELRNRYPSIF